MNIDPYSLCECGSGKKFKWCCKDKVQKELEEQEREDRRMAQHNLKVYAEELLLRGVRLP